MAYKEEQSKLKNKRLIHSKTRRELLEKKAAEQRETLSKIHLIVKRLFADIDDGSAASKSNKKLAVLKKQVQVRKNTYHFHFHTFEEKKTQLIKEVKEFIAANPVMMKRKLIHLYTSDPFSLVGRHVYHRFIDESTSSSGSDIDLEQWYEGFFLGYNATTRLHEIAYVEEEENFNYNLIDDLAAGDLKFND